MALAGSYLDVTEFKARTVAPASLVDGDFFDPTGHWTDPAKVARRDAWRTFVESRLKIATTKVESRLRKRYAVPFGLSGALVPEIVLGWIVAIVTPELYDRRGADPSDAQVARVIEQGASALEEVKEAADSEEGLFELPLRTDSPTTGVTMGGPYFYSEATAYDWLDVQADARRNR